jgi:hypothetical protein
MAYHDGLLAHALELIHLNPPTEMLLRRTVSAAYYAVFHLLIFESTQHWGNPALRAALGRAYDHGLMRTTSNRVLDRREFPYADEDPETVKALKEIARGFNQLQQDRHFADYNLSQSLEPGTAFSQVKRAERIFLMLPLVKNEQIMQEYLTLLLLKKRDV